MTEYHGAHRPSATSSGGHFGKRFHADLEALLAVRYGDPLWYTLREWLE